MRGMSPEVYLGVKSFYIFAGFVRPVGHTQIVLQSSPSCSRFLVRPKLGRKM